MLELKEKNFFQVMKIINPNKKKLLNKLNFFFQIKSQNIEAYFTIIFDDMAKKKKLCEEKILKYEYSSRIY